MKVFYNKEFTGHWPVGTAAVVVAENSFQAAQLLKQSLIPLGLDQQIFEQNMIEVDIHTPHSVILLDGNY